MLIGKKQQKPVSISKEHEAEYRVENQETEFAKYIADCKALAFYDTGVTAEKGDRLITLSTCEYTRKNGRFAVVAKKIA